MDLYGTGHYLDTERERFSDFLTLVCRCGWRNDESTLTFQEHLDADPVVRARRAEEEAPKTKIAHLNGDAPEQVAADLLAAAFSALSAVPSRHDRDTAVLASAQTHVSQAIGVLKAYIPGIV